MVTGIYKITSPIGKIYIGQSENIEKRFRNYKSLNSVKNQVLLYNSFLEYGIYTHVFEIIIQCEKSELNQIERYYQEFYNCVSETGLNMKLATCKNKQAVYSEASRKKMSENRTGEKNHQFGLRGEKNKRYGIKQSKEQKAKYAYRSGIKKSEEHKTKIGLPQMGELNHQAKLVIDTETGIYYGSVIDAAIAKNINRYTLSDWVNNRRGIKNKSSIILA